MPNLLKNTRDKVFIYFTPMTGINKKVSIAFLLIAAILIRTVSFFPAIVERYYSNGIYPIFSRVLKYSFGWIPFSLGDIIYIIAILWMLFKLTRMISLLVKRKVTRKLLLASLLNTALVLLSIYVIFNTLWGLNYNRQGIASQLGIDMKPYSKEELVKIDSMLLENVNAYKAAMMGKGNGFDKGNNFKLAIEAYDNIAEKYPFLKYNPASVKASLFGTIGNYIGFTGYYNPFTGEAQLNNTVPPFLHPFTTCHEIAHQLGYAKENEANFVGYLAASNSPDTAFRYSVYLDLYLYAQRNLYNADSTAAKTISLKMLPAVKEDLLFLRQFYKSYRNPLEPVFRWIYGKYLENNQQPSGLFTYDEVTSFLVAFYKKFGKL